MTDDRRESEAVEATPAAASEVAVTAPDDAGSAPAAAASGEAPAPRRGGRGLAVLALLVALSAAGAAAYLYYRLVLQAPVAALAAQLEASMAEQQQALDAQRRALAEQAATLREDLRRELTAEFDAELSRVRTANEDALAAAEAAMAEALRFEARSRAPAERLWGLAEVDYLLRAAAVRRLLPQDLPAAAALLQRADQALARLDDAAFEDLRAAIGRELEALEAYRPVDVQALYLDLETLHAQIADLPLAMPATGVSRLPPAREAPGDGFWPQLRSELEGLLTVRRLERPPVPLLPPEDVVYLGLNLRLQVERAQLALLRGEALVFRESLQSARAWLLDYALASPEELTPVVEALERLAEVPLSSPPPPAADLLALFRDARAHGS